MNNDLNKLRKQIDELDTRIIELLGQRMVTVKKVGYYKKLHNIPPLDSKRWNEVLESRVKLANEVGLGDRFIRSILNTIHNEALELEEKENEK